MNWIDIKEQKPEVGQEVWTLDRHWKDNYPCSYRIYAGEFEVGSDKSYRVTNVDDIGQGCRSWYPEHQPPEGYDIDTFTHWLPKEAIPEVSK